MKVIIFLLVFTGFAYCQIDSVLEVDNCTYYYIAPIKQNNRTIDSSKIIFRYGKYENISEFKFHKSDSLILKDIFEYNYSTNIKYASGIKMKTGSYFTEGALVGTGCGILIGALIGAISNESRKIPEQGNLGGIIFNTLTHAATPSVAIIGAVIGAVIGFSGGSIIGMLIEKTDYVDLKKINETQRKEELIRFIKSKK